VTSDRLSFCFGVHNHQPIGNFDSVLAEATERAYRPFFELVRRRPQVRLSVHCTGSLLAWLRAQARKTFDLLGETVAAGQVELLTGGFYEPILAILPDADKRGQIQ
jgi:4-alpha-glucanotransferase